MFSETVRSGRRAAILSVLLVGGLLVGLTPTAQADDCASGSFPVCDLYDRIVATIGADATLVIPPWVWVKENVACISILVPDNVPVQGYDAAAKIAALRAILIAHYDFGRIHVHVSVVLAGLLPLCEELPETPDPAPDSASAVAALFDTALEQNPFFIEAFVPTGDRPYGIGNVVAVFTWDVLGYPGNIDAYYGGRLFCINYVAEDAFALVLHEKYVDAITVTFTSAARE